MVISSNYSDTTGGLSFYSNHEAINFNAIIKNIDIFKFFAYKTKLVGETEAKPRPSNNKGTLKNETIVALLKYLSNFWRLLEMSLINRKVKLKLKWTKHCVLVAAGVENANPNSKNIIISSKDTKLYVLAVNSSAKAIGNYQNFFEKALKD